MRNLVVDGAGGVVTVTLGGGTGAIAVVTALQLPLQCQPMMSAGQLCDLRMRPVHVASRTAIYGFSTITDDATALR